MRKYKSAIYKHLHGEFQDLLADGKITPERMEEFERDCFITPADTPQASADHQPALSAANSGPYERSVK